jgi:acyl transferase domain-containing protein/NAD(P)-dependent dehydrogenase (short-subunit alcohol dehydrogenase family)/acyl carrier protein
LKKRFISSPWRVRILASDQASSDFLKRIQNLSPKRLALLAIELERRLAMRESDGVEPIAIIGMACRTPGGAETTEELWTLLKTGRDAIEKVPLSRWDADAFYDPRPDTPGKAITKSAGFVANGDQFDAAFFGISPREAPGIDPQHRMLLEVAWEALENAGERADRLEESNTGVFIGIGTGEYEQLMVQSDESALNAYSGSGVASSMAAGRLSHFLGLKGPSLSVDTACSASGVAIHLACQSLRTRECSRALAGGVNMLLTPVGLIIPSQAHMLAADGRCKTFSTLADGFARAEGCGVLVLKRFSDARIDGDRILGLIRGSAINHDGRSSSLTAPNGPAQEAVIKAALAQSRLNPSDIDHIEAHGTGTVLGDAIELGALANVFGTDRQPERPLLLSSVKTNLGHLEAAAGVTGVIKILLALHHEMLPPHLHLTPGNENEALNGMAFEIPTSPKKWPRSNRARIAGISSFGFSGTNSHLIVEEPPVSEPAAAAAPSPTVELITASAKTSEALTALCRKYARFLRENPQTALNDFAWTANGCRSQFQHRVAFIARSTEDAAQQLEDFSSVDPKASPLYRFAASYQAPPIAFLFTGQGSQYSGMGRAFYERNTAFRAAMDRCERAMEGKRKYPLTKVIFGDAAIPAGLIDDTAWTQPALFAFEYATAMMWQSWGVHPSIVIGHSLGEYVAACVAGILTLEEALALAAERGRLMGELPRNGSMMAVRASEQATMAALGSLPSAVSVAAVNGLDNTVLSGRTDQIDELAARLAAAGIKTIPLTVSHAFHSPMMEPMLDAFEKHAATLDYKQPRIEFVSNVTGRVLTDGEPTDAAYWRRHVRGTVRFNQGMDTLLAQNPSLLLEIGPNPVLLGMAKAGRPGMTVPSAPALRRGKDEWHCAFEALQQVYLTGAPIDWEGVYSDRACRKLALPTYPFQRQRFWTTATPRAAAQTSPRPVDANESINTELYRVQWTMVDPGSVTGGRPAHSVLLAGDGSELAKTKMALQARGIDVQEQIDRSSLFNGHPSEDLLKEREGIRSALRVADRPDAIVLLLPDHSDVEDIPAATLKTASIVLALLQEVVETSAPSPDVWLVTQGAIVCNQTDRPGLAASVAGAIAKVARLEHSDLRVFHADLQIEPTASDFGRLADLLREGMKEHAVALRGERIAIPRLVRFNSGESRSRLHIQPSGGYLVTGAFGGIGLRTAQWLVDSGARELYLVGRREPSAEVRARVNTFEAAGVSVHLVVADISKEAGIADLSTLVSKASAPLRGILHAAGVVDDGIMMHQTPERLATVFAPKVSGGWLLHKFSLQHPLDFFVLFGSAAALLGLSGQSNYVAANTFLDSLAEMRHQQGLPATSVAWGAWSSIGMATRVKVTQRSNVIGIGNIAPDRGVQLLEEAIVSGEPTLAALAFDWKLFFAARTAHHDWPLLEKLAGEVQNTGESAQFATLASLVEVASPRERLGVIKDYLKARIVTVLMLPRDYALHEDQPFAELGLDSLMALELKNELQTSTGAALPPTFLFEYRNLGLAATYLHAVMADARPIETTQAEASGYEEIVL